MALRRMSSRKPTICPTSRCCKVLRPQDIGHSRPFSAPLYGNDDFARKGFFGFGKAKYHEPYWMIILSKAASTSHWTGPEAHHIIPHSDGDP